MRTLLVRRPQPEGGKLTLKQRRVVLYKRKDFQAVREATSAACRCNAGAITGSVRTTRATTTSNAASVRRISDEADGLSMEDILGPANTEEQSQ